MEYSYLLFPFCAETTERFPPQPPPPSHPNPPLAALHDFSLLSLPRLSLLAPTPPSPSSPPSSSLSSSLPVFLELGDKQRNRQPAVLTKLRCRSHPWIGVTNLPERKELLAFFFFFCGRVHNEFREKKKKEKGKRLLGRSRGRVCLFREEMIQRSLRNLQI